MLNTLSLAEHGPVIPVIVLQRVEHAVPMAEALVAGGVKVLEVTLRTAVALQAIEAIAKAVPQAVLGAGTLRTARDAQAARDAGLPLLPGVATAGEVMTAHDNGLTFLKFFPAVPAGGVAMLKALHGPFPDVSFCPTGGISPDNAATFLTLPNVRVCGGSWLTPADAMEQGDWERITRLARDASALRRA
ncbi:MAG TPA: keto-deoxy-phosphogluconate aldolase [Burkholderiaceae bacterium]|nr:keto-deoxy-phosphogluconate aldolase [Burkholderiaceae bacterium]